MKRTFARIVFDSLSEKPTETPDLLDPVFANSPWFRHRQSEEGERTARRAVLIAEVAGLRPIVCQFMAQTYNETIGLVPSALAF